MGNNFSSETKQFFINVARDDKPPDEKVFTGHLARCKRDLCSGAELFHSSIPILRELIPSSVSNDRIRWLLQFCQKQLDHSSCNYTQGHDNVLVASLHITEFVVRYAHRVSCGNTADLIRIFGGDATGTTDSLSPSPTSTNEAGKLCVALMEYCVRVPVLPSTIETHGEVISLLLSMTSSALFHSTTFDQKHMDFFTEIILSAECFPAFFAVLLDRLLAWGSGRLPEAPMLYHDGYQPSLRNLYNVFGSSKAHKSIGSGDHLGRHSTQLLSVLVSYQKGTEPSPALEYMMGIQEDDRLRFVSLLTAFTHRLGECPALCMVFYTLVYDHHTFLHTVMTAHPKQLLDVVQEILHLSYKASTEYAPDGMESDAGSCSVTLVEEELQTGDIERLMRSMAFFSYPFISFMTSTLVLLFSQDQMLNKLMNDTIVTPRFKIARHVGTLAISSVCIVVLTHGISRALNERNEPLAAVFIPSLSNLSPFIHNVDAFTSQRLIKLLILTKRKLRRAAEQDKVGQDASDDNSINCPQGDKIESETKSQEAVDMFQRQLSALAEAIEGMLQGDDRKNDALIYELLYNRAELFDDVTVASPLLHLTAAYKALLPLLRIVEFYETEIASVTSADSYQGILSVIRRVTREQAGAAPEVIAPVSSKIMPSVQLKTREVLFLYEESANSYDFFGPFVWSTLLSDAEHPGGILWTANPNTLQMFPK